MLTLYGIPNCDTVKKARVWLAEHSITYQFHDYKKEGLTREIIELWLEQKSWQELLNTNGTTYRKLDVKPSDTESAIEAMLNNPSVIRRPLVEKDKTILIQGFKPESYENLFS